MAKVVAPLYSISASGKIAGRLVFSRRSSGQQVRLQKSQVDIVTLARSTQRAIYTYAVSQWNLLSDSQKKVYDTRAHSLHMTGYNFFMRLTIFAQFNDPDALLFFQALADAGVPLSDTIKPFINSFVLGLKHNGLWTKLRAIYPIVGGTATSHKFNLKDPRDLDSAFRLAFHGSLTHSATGILPTGALGYAETFLNPFVELSVLHLGYYSRSNVNTNADQVDIGSADTNYGYVSCWYHASGFDKTFARNTSSVVGLSGPTGTTDARGFFQTSKVAGISSLFKNDVRLDSQADSANLPNVPVYLLASNIGGPVFNTNRECAFASIGQGFTDAESVIFYDLIQSLQTSLGREV